MAYAVKYILQFTSDRGNEIRIEVLKKDYQGEVIYKSLGGSPSLSIEQGDGAIKGSSLVFAMQADIEGELQELYTIDNKQFKVNMYRNEVLSWQGYILPELYSEEYVDAPYDVSVTATDQLATLKAITYQREDVNVSLSTIIEDILSFTQISVPVTYHQNLSAHRKGEVPMLVDSHISQAAYNGHSCYDVLNNILLSCNCCIMQINGEWLITSLTNSTTNYYTAGVTQVREHKALGQLGVGEVCPAGTLTMVNNPALKGARVEYAHMLRHSFLVNADCVDREGWNYTPDSRNPIDIPGEREAFGKIFKAYCWELHPVNIRENNSLQLWQEVSLEKDERNYYDLSVKTLFGTNAKLLLMAVTYLGSDGVERRLTSEGWIETWDKSDVNYYIQITGTNKNAGLDAIADIEQYEMSTVQFALPPVDGTMRVGFINSTTDYAEPLASAPIYVSQVYLTVSGVTGQECTTEVEPNATQKQQDVLLAYGDTFESENAYKLGLNTLKKSSGENITSWWLDNVNFSSYYDTMLQEFSRYFGVKKAQLQGIIMGKDVLSDMYADVFSGRVMRLLTAQVDMLADEASVTVEEVVTTTVDFNTVIYATNNTNSFGSSSGGGAGTSGGASSTAGESLLGVQSDGDVYVKDGRALVGSEARFEKMALPSSAPDKRAEQKTYIYSSDTSRGAIDIAKIAKYIEEQEKIWVLDSANGVVRTQYNVVSTQEIISGRRASGASSDVTGGGGISQVTAQMIVDALGYIPYSSQNPSGYITSSALNGYAKISDIPSLSGYATQAWVEGKKYLTAIPSEYITETELSNTLGGYQTKITSSNKLAYSLISGTPTLATVATSGKYSDLSGVPTSLPASDVSDWAKAATKPTYTASEVGALPLSGGTISNDSNTQLTLNTSSGVTSEIAFHASNIAKAEIGWNNVTGVFLYNSTAKVSMGIKDDGTPRFGNNTLIHTGNLVDTIDKRYLSITGGEIYSESYSPLRLKTTNTQNRLEFVINNTTKALVGYHPTYGAWLYNPNGNGYIGIKDDGTPHYNSNTLIHSGNISSQNVNSARKLYFIGAVPSSGFDANTALPGGGRMSNYASGGWWGSTMPAMSYGTIYQLQGDDTNNDLAGQLAWDVNHRGADSTRNLWWRANDDTNFSNAKWHKIAFTDSNVASADYASNAGSADMLAKSHSGNINFSAGSALKLIRDWGEDGVSLGYPTKYQAGLSVMTDFIGWQMTVYAGATPNPYFRSLQDTGVWKEWKQLAFLTDNVASATKLQTARTIWGQSFDGTANVSGVLTLPANHQLQWVNSNSMIYGNGSNITISNTGNLTIATSGNVLIGTNADSGNGAKLQVSGNLTATGEVISSRRASSSDRRLKNNITYLDTADCLAMVRQIRPAEWDWKDNGKHSMGFIAQDVEHLMPYAVTSIKDIVLGQKLNLQYDQFIALAIGGVQAVDNEVQQLKKEVKKLKEKLAKYEHNGNYRN